jgi:hypothetical protein
MEALEWNGVAAEKVHQLGLCLLKIHGSLRKRFAGVLLGRLGSLPQQRETHGFSLG